MVNIYIPKFLEDIPYVPLLIPNLGPIKFGGELFRGNAFKDFKDPVVEIVSNISDADFILLPHNFLAVRKNKEYLKVFSDLYGKYKKNIIIFAYGDRDLRIDLPGALVFKYSMYKSSKLPNEIKMPTYVEDLGNNLIEFRQKHAGIPIVGFCGWADYGGNFLMVKTMIKNFIIDLQAVFYGGKWRFRKKGIYFRKKILGKLADSKLVTANFIIRKTFSSHKKTIELNPELARKQYIGNILNSDFSIAIRGDGNYSMRFYEILSLGRIPVLIDTDKVLPLEDKIDYDDFILRISPKDFDRAGWIISDFYAKLTNEEFLNMQKKAREAFEKYLRVDSFYKFIFSDVSKLKSIV